MRYHQKHENDATRLKRELTFYYQFYVSGIGSQIGIRNSRI